MPIKHKRSEWEKEENKNKILLKIQKNPSTFTELLSEVDLVRSTLAQHLKNLEKEGSIERIFKDNKILYQVNLARELVILELNFADINIAVECKTKNYSKYSSKLQESLSDLSNYILDVENKEI